MPNSEGERQHKKRQRHRQQERRQEELNCLLRRIAPLSESSLCQECCGDNSSSFDGKMIANMYQSIPPLSAPLDFWSKVPDICNPNAAVMDSTLIDEAIDSKKLARDRRFQTKLQQKLELRQQRGEISKEERETLWQQHGRRHQQQQQQQTTTTTTSDDQKDNDDNDSSNNAVVVSLLSASRGQRKSWQVENFVTLLEGKLPPGSAVVDFGCGSGNLCLALAAYFPQVRFVLVDKNDYSLQLVQRRAEASNLHNIQVQQFTFSSETLGEYRPPPPPPDFANQYDRPSKSKNKNKLFDLGLGLHCCGAFTDMVMELCRLQNADCIVCPCCNGGMKFTCGFQYPRSTFLKSCMNQDEYICQLSKSADDFKNYAAKCWIEFDRAQWAHEQGMEVELWKMTPVECTPKHHVLYIKHKE